MENKAYFVAANFSTIIIAFNDVGITIVKEVSTFVGLIKKTDNIQQAILTGIRCPLNCGKAAFFGFEIYSPECLGRRHAGIGLVKVLACQSLGLKFFHSRELMRRAAIIRFRLPDS